jgi:hypothetical protein
MIEEANTLLRGDTDFIVGWLARPSFRSLARYCLIISIGFGCLWFHTWIMARSSAIALHRDQVSADYLSHIYRQWSDQRNVGTAPWLGSFIQANSLGDSDEFRDCGDNPGWICPDYSVRLVQHATA